MLLLKAWATSKMLVSATTRWPDAVSFASGPDVPTPLSSALDQSQSEFLGYAAQPIETWDHEYTRESIHVASMAMPGRSERLFRCQVDVDVSSEEQSLALLAKLSDYKERAKWDAAIVLHTVLRRYSDKQEHAIVSYTSAVAVGGLVRARIFVDIRRLARLADGSLLYCSLDWPHEDHQLPMEGYVRGHVLPGCGIMLTPLSPGRARLCYIGAVDMGGWLPPKVINHGLCDAFWRACHEVHTSASRTARAALTAAAGA